MDVILEELYDALVTLRYPETAKIEKQDIARVLLTGQNRISLLIWLLSQASTKLSSHLEKFEGKALTEEVVKCYSQIGLCIDENTLLGVGPLKRQLPLLKKLLLFTQSLDSSESVPIDDLSIYEVLDKHLVESINIIPTSCKVSMEPTGSAAKKYLDELEQTIAKQTSVSSDSDLPRIEPLPVEALVQNCANKVDPSHKAVIEDGQTQSLTSVAEAFSAAFNSNDFSQNSKLSDCPADETVNIDETIHNLNNDLSFVAQVFKSKKAIATTTTPKCLDKGGTPLSVLIEDNVIISQEIKALSDQYHIDS
ncbi:uncharacterized protein LOC105692298 [Athalia rosae]|uniref:uncharacterized protein LOC105692298 n=1 Tax=Athalia rosae TaxID=37344 RepID=UPI002033D3EF|nr:uncharacterized protein LOC105692298 [Athalia rosae]XP_012266824.2 uncharacterized protein LOC105692298 [Athalia rosae]XP_012266825.2 uncharacterized protein LOC105692298 [Athalia rosae]XP_048506468.1 uncharacterized protein LOC105692298 [Athalia rosae]